MCGYYFDDTETEYQYKILLNYDGGSSTSNVSELYMHEFDKTKFPLDVVKTKYAFLGWSYNGQIVIDKNGNILGDIVLIDDMTFVAVYEESIKLTITYSLYNPKTNELINTYTKKPSEIADVSETNNYKFNTYASLHSYPKEGYTFIGWYNEDLPLSTSTEYNYIMSDEDFEVEARFKYTNYDLTICSNNVELGQVMIKQGTEQTFYDDQTLTEYYKEKVTVAAFTKTSVRFLGWYNQNNQLVSPNAVYSFEMINKDYVLEAKWNYFKINYDLNGGINNLDNPSSFNADGSNIVLKNPTRDGFVFVGWEYKDNIIENINVENKCDMNLKALWNYYTLTTNVNERKAGSITTYDEYKFSYDDEVTIEALTNIGYTFDGWYDGDVLLTNDISYSFKMPSRNLIYTAKWTVNKYFITVDNYVNNIIVNGVVSGNEYGYGSLISLTTINNTGLFIVWKNNDDVVQLGDDYSFIMPANDVNISINVKNDDRIYFGKYPQSKVTDDLLINELNIRAGDLPTSNDKKNWIDYNYYIKSNITSYMYYQDIDYDNDGELDYRGVYFTKYRPWKYRETDSSATYSYQDDNGYLIETIYWFKYDPIEWIVLNETNGKSLLCANLILDCQMYYPNKSNDDYFLHNGSTGFAYDYNLSDIRLFLLNDFYNLAFNDMQKSIIDIQNRVFLLSLDEVEASFTTENSRVVQGTEYAKVQGLYVRKECNASYWMLRNNIIEGFDYEGIRVVSPNGIIGGGEVYCVYYGVRPACWITI